MKNINIRYVSTSFMILVYSLGHSQSAYKMADYVGFDNEKEWYLDEHLYQAYQKGDYILGAKKMDTLLMINPEYNRMNILLGAVSYDQTKQYQKALDLMVMARSANIDVCHENEYRNVLWSSELQKSEDFISMCSVYPLAPSLLPATNPEFRDSIIKYFLWQSPPGHKSELFVKLGYESFYDNIPQMNHEDFIQLIFSKYDQLIDEYGFPTVEMVGSYLVQRMAYITVAHNPDLKYLKKHQGAMKKALPPKKYALLEDKIRVAEGRPQLYGTQATVCAPDGKPTGFYEIEDRKNVNKRRMAVGLHPLEIYEQEINSEFNVNWSDKN